MRSARKIATIGLASLAMTAGILAAPFAQAAHAQATAVENLKTPQKSVTLQEKTGRAVKVTTEADCSTHTLTAHVKNKTGATITPDVTFNNHAPTVPSTLPIEAGQTGNYYYNFSGNHLLIDTKVQVDAYDPVTVSPTMYCTEPVSFKVMQSSDSAVTGDLTNNSTLVPQTVYTRVGNGDTRLEVLEPGETRTIALPFTGMEGQTDATVTIATSAGYESSYTVKLSDVNQPQPLMNR